MTTSILIKNSFISYEEQSFYNYFGQAYVSRYILKNKLFFGDVGAYEYRQNINTKSKVSDERIFKFYTKEEIVIYLSYKKRRP